MIAIHHHLVDYFKIKGGMDRYVFEYVSHGSPLNLGRNRIAVYDSGSDTPNNRHTPSFGLLPINRLIAIFFDGDSVCASFGQDILEQNHKWRVFNMIDPSFIGELEAMLDEAVVRWEGKVA